MSVNLINFIQKEENLRREGALLGASKTQETRLRALRLSPLHDPPIQLFPSLKSRCSHRQPIQMCPCDLAPAVTTAIARSPHPAVIPTTPIQPSSPSGGPPSPQDAPSSPPAQLHAGCPCVPASPVPPTPILSLPLGALDIYNLPSSSRPLCFRAELVTFTTSKTFCSPPLLR